MPKLNQTMYVINALLQIYIPDLWAHFIEIGVRAEHYAPKWFMTLFIVAFPVSVATRIFDTFLNDGKKVLYKVCIAFFKQMKQKMMTMDFAEAVDAI